MRTTIAILAACICTICACSTTKSSYTASSTDVAAYNALLSSVSSCNEETCPTTPTIKRMAAPAYPLGAWESGKTGVAIVIFDVETSGKVSNAQIESASHQEFASPSLEAINQFEFNPATLGGEPIKQRLRIPFSFSP